MIGCLLAAGLSGTRATAAPPPADGWRIRFEARIDGLGDQGRLVIGAGTGALDGRDVYDDPHPPALPRAFLDLVTEHRTDELGWEGQERPTLRYRAQYDSPLAAAASRSVQFVLETDRTGTANLSWAMAADIDLARHFAVLRAVPSGAVLVADMWAQSTLALPVTPGRRLLQLDLTPGRPAPPIAHDQDLVMNEDQSLAVTLTATDPDGDLLTYRIASGPAHGTLQGAPPNVLYVPATNYNGPDAFTFLASDATADSNLGTVSIIVLPVNDAPVAAPQSVTTDEDTPVAVTLAGTDVDGDPLTFTIQSPPAHGTFSGTAPNLTYTPAPDYHGADSFTFRANDLEAPSAPATVDITVRPVNDPPVAGFTVAGEAREVATWENNAASFLEGASVVAFSSQNSTSFTPTHAIDDVTSSRWRSASGQPANQFMTVALPAGRTHRVTAIRLANGDSSLEGVKRFQVLASNTGTADADFTSVLSDVAVDNNRVQEFPLASPVEARYLKLLALDNWGSTCCVSVRSFEAITADRGGVPTFLTSPANVALVSEAASATASTFLNASFVPNLAIDGNTSTRWLSGTGQVLNQSLVVQLARGKSWPIDRVRLHAVVNNTQSVKEFRIDVSDTTADPGAFSPVLTAQANNLTGFQDFPFPGGPVNARYVRLAVLSNHNATTGVSLAELQVIPVPAPAPSYSSYADYTSRPEMLLDNVPGTAWLSASGQVTNQFVELALAAPEGELIDRVRLQPWTGAIADAVRDFEVWVSQTDTSDGAFVQVLADDLLNNGQLQEFELPGGPVRARYVKLWARNNHGSATTMRLASFEVLTPSSQGHVVSLPAAPVEVTALESPAQIANGATVTASSALSGQTANLMLDYVSSGVWTTATKVGQFATIQLGGSAAHTLAGVRVGGRSLNATDSVKEFEVWVSQTTADPASFSLAFSCTGSCTVVNDGTIQTFLFPAPVAARFVRYVPVSNYNHATNIATANFDVIATNVGGVYTATTDGGPSVRPEYALDGATSTWRTRQGSFTNQSVKVLLQGGATRTVYGVSVLPESSLGPRDVQIRVSTTTADDAAFTTVFTGILPQQEVRRELYFSAPVAARYVQFLWVTGYSTIIGVRELEVLEAPATGGVLAGFTSQSSDTNSPLRALDFDRANGVWLTASGQNTNQSATVLLPAHRSWVVDRVSLQPRTDSSSDFSPREFEVQVAAGEDFEYTTVLVGALRNDFALQDFYFPPTQARAVRVVLKNGYGNAQLGLQTFWVYSPELGAATVRFLDRSLARDGDLASYLWDFGDGSSSTERDPVHTYGGPGQYEVVLRVTDANGLVDEHTVTYRVFGGATASFTFAPAAPNESQSVTFTDTSTDPLGITTREWIWADGTANTPNQASASHAFGDNGTYPVTLRVANGHGIFAEVTRPVTVANVTPTVDGGPNQTVVWDQNWAVGSSVSDAGTVDRTSLLCTWDFGDGQTASVPACNLNNSRVAHSWAQPGTYTATLTVRDKDGASASDSLTVTVNKRTTMVNVYAALSATPAGEVVVAAKVVDRFELNESMAGKAVSFATGTQTVIGTADADGVATALLAFAPGVVNTVTVSFAGDGFYLPSSDTDAFNPVPVFPDVPSIRYDRSEQVAMVPSPGGHVANGGVLSTVGFAGGYAPLILLVDPLVIGNPNLPNPLPSFDTVALNGICTIGSSQFLGNATFRGRIQDFVLKGGKLIIWDSECTNTNYSNFFLPFTTNNPGAQGATCPVVVPPAVPRCALQIAEENTLSSSIPTSPAFINVDVVGRDTDAVGDANVFVTFDPNWCVAMRAKNVLIPDYKPVHTYAVLGRGLIIYNGLDRDAMQANAAASPGSGTFFLARIWERELVQAWNPSGLPCDVAATEATITLTPATAVLDVGAVHSVTAVVRNATGAPIPSVFVALEVKGANPFTQQLTTNASGSATFTYTGANVGDDSLVARAGAIASNLASAHWNGAPVADAGPDRSELTGAALALDGTGSTDPNPADVLLFTWTQTAGPPVTLADANTATPRFTPTLAGDYTFELRVSDGRLSDTDSVTLHVELRNRPPVAVDQSVETAEDTELPLTLGASDPDGDPLTFTVLSGPSHGTLSGTGANRTYVPAPDYHGPDLITFQVNDGTVDSNVATVSITVVSVNDPPVAEDVTATTPEDTPVAITLTATDVDGGAPSIRYTQPAHGTYDGVTYTPAADFHGTDTFTYRAEDADGAFADATVTITVTPVNDPPVARGDAFTTPEDTALTGNVLANDTDVDGDALAAVLTIGPLHGTLILNSDGSFTYTPAADYHGPDGFTYEAGDPSGEAATGQVQITVTPVNDAPVARDDAFTTPEDTALTGTVLANDTDVDGDTLTAVLTIGPSNGTAVLNPDGGFTYTPAADYHGPDGFTYEARDSSGEAATAQVRITVTPVNDGPVAQGDVFTTPEDTALTGNVLANDTDADRDTLTAVVTTGPSSGALLLNPDGSFTYTPAADFHGDDGFTYEARDPAGEAATAQVRITVTPVNDAPVARDDAFTTPEDTALTGNVLGNDTDVDGDTLTAAVTIGPSNGTLVLDPDGNFTYTPAADYHGPDGFTYEARDPGGEAATAQGRITVTPVNDPPVARDDAFTTPEDTALTGNVLANDTDVDGDALTTAVTTGPSHGTVVLNPDGGFTYTPTADYHGPDGFTYEASDPSGEAVSAQVQITVTPANDRPVAQDDAFTTPEETALTGNVLTNDTDVDADALTAVLTTGPSNGALALNPDGGFTYTPAANYNGPDGFAYEARDPSGAAAGAQVRITVTPVNDPPVAIDQAVATDEDTAVGITLGASDVDGDALTYTIVTAPLHGTLSGTGANRTYTPALNYNGPDSFTFRARDAALDSNLATVSITVRPVNDAPVCTGAVASPARILLWPPNHVWEPIAVQGLTDVEGDTITVRATAIRQDEHVHAPGTGNTAPDAILEPIQVRIERQGPADGRFYHITFTASDGNGGECTGTVTVCVPHDQGNGPQCVDQGPIYNSLALQ